MRRLLADLRPHFTDASGHVVNTVYGDVSGTLIQARDIHGGIELR
ncbi:hypothetical protein [Nocardiopsis trehalosi]|nr:hypothetical protein [Nocardiopsis trehalosi]